MMIGRCWVFIASAVVCLMAVEASTAAEIKPSFDCKAARSDPEKAICASPALAALDVRVAVAFQKAMAGLDAPGQEALRTDQRYFLESRDVFFDTPYYDLKGDLTNRARMLEAIVLTPRPGWDGTWASIFGEITISPSADGYQVNISTVALTVSQPSCDLEAGAIVQGNALVAGTSPADLKENEGWTVRLTRNGAILLAELVPPKDAPAGGPPFCGNVPSIGGAFLPVRTDHGPKP